MQFFFAGRGGKSCALLCSSGVMPIKMALKQKGVHFVLCPKQGNKIEGVVINRVCVLRIFCRKKGQGPRCSAAHLYPNIGRLSPNICALYQALSPLIGIQSCLFFSCVYYYVYYWFSVSRHSKYIKIKIKTVQWIKSGIWEMKGGTYTKTMAKIQVR